MYNSWSMNEDYPWTYMSNKNDITWCKIKDLIPSYSDQQWQKQYQIYNFVK